MSKIDIDKFICNLFATGAFPAGSKERVYVENALYDCGYEYYGGEIVERKEEPKFKVGDWITNGDYTWKIVDIKPLDYILQSQDGNIVDDTISYVNKQFHSFTIADAKPGDVLVDSCQGFNNPFIFILKKFETVDFGLTRPSDFSSYCYLTMSDKQKFKEGAYHHMHNGIKPATKEQRDLLFFKMKEEGYEWDAEKKELKKINKEHPLLSDFFNDEYERGKADALKITTWSEEDEYTLYETIQHLEELIRIDKAKHLGCDVQYYQRDIDWLKSLKERLKG